MKAGGYIAYDEGNRLLLHSILHLRSVQTQACTSRSSGVVSISNRDTDIYSFGLVWHFCKVQSAQSHFDISVFDSKGLHCHKLCVSRARASIKIEFAIGHNKALLMD